ncbi:hypothetical protein NBO_65g0019, partial [Nosema bombycis CQ1]
MKVIIISLFVSLISAGEKNVIKAKTVFEDEDLKKLSEALQTNYMDNKQQQTLKLLGKVLESGEILDNGNKHREKFEIVGKAILDNTLDEKGQQEQSQIQGDAPATPSHNNIGEDAQELTFVDDEDEVALKRLKEVLKSDNFLNETKEKIMDLISKVLGYEKLLHKEHLETFRLLGRVLSFSKFVDSNYSKTLKLLGDAIVSNQISKNRNNEILKFLSNVFIKKTPLDKEASRQLAEMLVKKEHSENNVSKPQASTINIIQEIPLPLSDEAVDESNKNQVSHIETLNETAQNDDLPGEQNFTTVDQNAENASMEITESPEPKRRRKRSVKSNVKSNSDSLNIKNKSKKSRKSFKKTKRSRRSTKDTRKPKSKNKYKRSKRQKSKVKTEISSHDGESNLNDLDTDMMGDDPNAYNENSHSEAPFTQTASAKPIVVDPKTNDKSSISYKNDNSKLFNSYYPEEYKRFVPLNPAIAYRRPKMLFLNDDNQVAPKLKTIDGDQSQGGNFRKHDLKPQKIIEVPKNRLFLTFTVSRSVY